MGGGQEVEAEGWLFGRWETKDGVVSVVVVVVVVVAAAAAAAAGAGA